MVADEGIHFRKGKSNDAVNGDIAVFLANVKGHSEGVSAGLYRPLSLDAAPNSGAGATPAPESWYIANVVDFLRGAGIPLLRGGGDGDRFQIYDELSNDGCDLVDRVVSLGNKLLITNRELKEGMKEHRSYLGSPQGIEVSPLMYLDGALALIKPLKGDSLIDAGEGISALFKRDVPRFIQPSLAYVGFNMVGQWHIDQYKAINPKNPERNPNVAGLNKAYAAIVNDVIGYAKKSLAELREDCTLTQLKRAQDGLIVRIQDRMLSAGTYGPSANGR